MAEICYMCIDLKKFYASAECAARELDPDNTDLVVADPSRGKGAICLAVSPAIHAKGVKNRCRLYEIPNNIDYIIAKATMILFLPRKKVGKSRESLTMRRQQGYQTK